MPLIDPKISVDCVVFGYDFKDLNVLLLDRTLMSDMQEPIFTDYTLLGNHIYEGEDIQYASLRILKELTGFENVFPEHFQKFAHPSKVEK